MGIVQTTLAKLTGGERAEIEAIVAEARAARPRDTDRFVSDEGDGLAFHLLAGVAALGGLAAAVLERAAGRAGRPWIPTSVAGIANSPTLPLVLVTVPVLVYCVVTVLRVHGRHGWMATSFGVVRLRGPSVRLLRYGDVARAARRRVPSRRGSFDVLDLAAADGAEMTVYATPLMDTILARVPPTAIQATG